MDGENEICLFEDEEGREYAFTPVLNFSFRGGTYCALLPADTDPEDEDYGLLVMREENGSLTDIADENEAEAAFEEALLILDGMEE